MSRIQIIQGDALDLPIDDHSIDLVVTSPPYFAYRRYLDDGAPIGHSIGNEPTVDEYLVSLRLWMREMARVLKPSGSCFVNLGDKFAGSGGHNNRHIGASEDRGPTRYVQDLGGVQKKSAMGLPWRFVLPLILEDGWILRADIIWKKNSIPDPTKDRVEARDKEYLFHLVRQGSYWADLAAISNDSARPGSIQKFKVDRLPISDDILARFSTDRHFAAFPPRLPAWTIRGWCPPDGTVLDPFGGSGTTALVCKVLNRGCISVDLSHGYTRLSRWRVFASDHPRKLREKWLRDGVLAPMGIGESPGQEEQ